LITGWLSLPKGRPPKEPSKNPTASNELSKKPPASNEPSMKKTRGAYVNWKNPVNAAISIF
jgi:hypothetical protein